MVAKPLAKRSQGLSRCSSERKRWPVEVCLPANNGGTRVRVPRNAPRRAVRVHRRAWLLFLFWFQIASFDVQRWHGGGHVAALGGGCQCVAQCSCGRASKQQWVGSPASPATPRQRPNACGLGQALLPSLESKLIAMSANHMYTRVRAAACAPNGRASSS